MSEPDDRIDLSVEDALAALDVQSPDDEPRVHCFLPAYGRDLFGRETLTLIGADWPLDQVRELFENDPNGPEVAGPGALGMHHGVGVRETKGDPKRCEKFFATRPDWVPPTTSTRVRVTVAEKAPLLLSDGAAAQPPEEGE